MFKDQCSKLFTAPLFLTERNYRKERETLSVSVCMGLIWWIMAELCIKCDRPQCIPWKDVYKVVVTERRRLHQTVLRKIPSMFPKYLYAHSLSPVRLEGIQWTDNDTDPWGWENGRLLHSTLYNFKLLDLKKKRGISFINKNNKKYSHSENKIMILDGSEVLLAHREKWSG